MLVTISGDAKRIVNTKYVICYGIQQVEQSNLCYLAISMVDGSIVYTEPKEQDAVDTAYNHFHEAMIFENNVFRLVI